MTSKLLKRLTSAVKYLAMQASLIKGLPASFRRAALYVSSRAASICVATCAIWCCIPWNTKSAITTSVNALSSRGMWVIANMGLESFLDLHLEVKDAFSKLHPLSSVRNRVVKATLCQPKHLKHTQTDKVSTCSTLMWHSVVSIRALLTSFNWNENILFTWAAIPILPSFSIPMAYLYPWPTCPKMFVSGT